MSSAESFESIAARVHARLKHLNVSLTMGGEPTYVPFDPVGPEWNFAAVGPTKLKYAYAFANALIKETLPGGVVFFSPGKSYPGEVNPRWALNLVSNRDGSPIHTPARRAGKAAPTAAMLARLRKRVSESLELAGGWLKATDPTQRSEAVWVLPLDHTGTAWRTDRWQFPRASKLAVLNADGPAGLRLPFHLLPPEALRRALVLELRERALHLFLPPLIQQPFVPLLRLLVDSLEAAGIGHFYLEGYIPSDDLGLWKRLTVAADPGVIEVNLPPCESAVEYRWWLEELERCANIAGLRSHKEASPEDEAGTGGGNHLLLGGRSLDDHPFFTRPGWVASILRYWQHHPALSYLFTGHYVGASSQAPRPDESARDLYDLELAYQYLESLGDGDHRYMICETLRHLHIDASGNSHRSEVSFDKFWNVNWEGGCRGLLEFRAVESLPHADWMAAVALLWQTLALRLLEHPFRRPLTNFGRKLHDHYFLPSLLWADLELILGDLRRHGHQLHEEPFARIWNWRFPRLLRFDHAGSWLEVRRAHEDWPLLCETPLEGGTTSRFVDTSIERLEFAANEEFVAEHMLYIQGRPLELGQTPDGRIVAGLRYRRSALYPSLHPGIAPQLPLYVTLRSRSGIAETHFKMEASRRTFRKCQSAKDAPKWKCNGKPCRRLKPELITFDLRLD